MALSNTIKDLRHMLDQIMQDLAKAEGGNKAAAQRVRTTTVRLEKVAKVYRKESISSEKSTKETKKSSKKAPAKVAAKPVAKKGAAAPAPAAAAKAKPKAKVALAKPRALAIKRPTAKLPMRKVHA